MSTDFDPYREWLGIEPHEQPVNHYRLLGVTPFTHDLQAIGTAADERMALIRKFQMGQRGSHTQPILNALAGAKLCLLNPSTKSSYDAVLMAHLGMHHAHGDIRQPPPATPQTQSAPEPPPSGPPRSEQPPSEPPIEPPLPPPPPPVENMLPMSSHPVYPAFQPVGYSSRTHEAAEFGEEEYEEGSSLLLPLGLAIGLVLVAILAGGIYYAMQSPPAPTDPAAPVAHVPPSPGPNSPANIPSEVQPETVSDEPVATGQEGDGSFRFAPSAAQLTENLALENTAEGDRIVGWQASGDQAVWMFRVSKPGAFKARLEYTSSVPMNDDGGSFSLAVPDLFERVRTISGGEGIKQDSFYVAVTRSGTHRLEFTSQSIQAGEQFQLISVQLLPPGTD